MKIKHEHIRMAMNAWAHPDGEKVPAAKITKAYFELGMTFPELYDDSHPEALARNTQKIFRWLDKDTPDAVEKMQALLPAIEKAMPPSEVGASLRRAAGAEQAPGYCSTDCRFIRSYCVGKVIAGGAYGKSIYTRRAGRSEGAHCGIRAPERTRNFSTTGR